MHNSISDSALVASSPRSVPAAPAASAAGARVASAAGAPLALPRRLAGLPHRDLPGGTVVLAAATPLARLRGLAGLPVLPAGVGLHLPGCASVHTIGMRFALDLIWLDSAGRAVRVDQAVGPYRLRACRRARSALEVGAGQADGFLAGLEAGR